MGSVDPWIANANTVPPDAGVEQRAEPTIIVNIPSTQRNLLDELQGIDMSSSAFPQPPQQALQLQGAEGLSGPVASGAGTRAGEPTQPSGPIPLATINGAGGTTGMPSIFGNTRPGHSHSQGQGWGGSSLSTPSLWSSVNNAMNNLGDLGGGGSGNGTIPPQEPAVTGGKAMSAKEKLILQVMEEMEIGRDVAVEIVGEEEEEEEEVDEVTKVVLIPKAQDKSKDFADIFADETIEPLELKLRNIMDAQLNTTRLVAERGKVATDQFTLGIFRQRDINDRPHTVYAVDTNESAISDFLRSASFQFSGFDFSGATFDSWLQTIDRVKFSGTTYAAKFGPFPFVMNEEKFTKYKNAFKIYGAVTHYIFYANRSIVVGFALEGKPPPTRRLKISLVDKGTYMGNLHPIHDIKLLGAPCCASCPAIFDGAHLPECEANKLKAADLAKLRKKRVFQAETRAKREAEPGE